ncbi:MAG: tetratricopeptide repeat protein [Prevotellaceae bacterium]|nr:tetratricopeptide repeat protein [Prevotellaceae bacterium]
MYKHTIEIDPKFYNAYYNLGALYYNKGVECIKEADAIKDWKDPKIKELEQQAEVEFKKALEPFLKAHELEPNDKYALETVKNLYFRFRNENDDMMNLYKQYKDKFDALEQEPQAAPQQ